MYLVRFRDKYAEPYGDPPEYDDDTEKFATVAEAEAFAAGLTYGDEPQYVTLAVAEPVES